MAYGWQILLNGTDITDKCSGFSITSSLESYCREMTLDIADASLYASLDFSQISESPEVEILTKNGTAFVSQGLFFIEKPAIISATHSELMTGVWGRSITAMLAEPFAPKVSKAWTERTTFLGIVEEMCDLAGFTWNASYCEIDDFVIYANTYECDNAYPIDVITELAELAGALVTTDRSGHLCIKQIEYSPTTADFTVTDDEISKLTESPEWPTFGNRVSITPTGTTAGYAVTMTVDDECLPADSSSRTKLYAQVTDEDGEPVNGVVVAWSKTAGAASLLDYPTSNTKTTVIQNEKQKASDFYHVTVKFEPSSIVGIWAAADTQKKTNLASDGYTLNGNTIMLDTKLSYCNQSLIITYESDGIAVNYLTAGDTSEDVNVTADVEGETDTCIVYIDNPCQCPPSIDLTANPTYIKIDGTSQLLVYVEESGPVTIGKYVFMNHVGTKRGKLSWAKARIGTVSIKNEKTVAQNDIDGVTQCEISMYPKSVSAVYRADDNGEATGPNLYSSHDAKVINLMTEKDTGTDLLVNYVAQGAALNKFTGKELGTAKIRAWIASALEEGCEATCTIDIEDNDEPTDDYPPDYDYYEDDFEEEEEDPGGEDEEYDTSADTSGTEQADFNWCVPDSVSEDPTVSALGARFATALEHDCDCQTLCEAEWDIYGTTQGYDGASGRKVSQIVIEDYGLAEGSPEYWEKYEEIKQEAINQCREQCDECYNAEEFELDDENTADTIVAGGFIGIYITGGVAPYTFETSSFGYDLNGMQSYTTEGQSVTLSCSNGTCGTDFDPVASVTVTDACGSVVTADVRNTSGGWVLIESKGNPIGTLHVIEYIVGKYKYIDDNCCYDKDEGTCANHNCVDVGCYGPPYCENPEGEINCGCSGTETWEWSCS